MELNTIFPDTTVTLSDGSTVDVKPFTFGQLPKALALSKNIFGLISTMYADSDHSAIAGTVLTEGGEDFLSLLSLSTGKPRAWFDTLQADDGLAITVQFLEVNLSFFAQKVVPAFKTGMNRLKSTPGLTL